MASIHRRPRSPYWHGAFRQAGKLVLRSTGSTDKAVARRIADEWEQIAHQAEAGTHIEQQTRDVIAGILKRANVESHSIKSQAVEAFLEAWLASKLSALAKGSAWSYQKSIDGFLTWAGKKAALPIAALQPQDARAYIAGLQSANYCTTTIILPPGNNNRRCTVFHLLFSYLGRQTLLLPPYATPEHLRATIAGRQEVSLDPSRSRRTGDPIAYVRLNLEKIRTAHPLLRLLASCFEGGLKADVRV